MQTLRRLTQTSRLVERLVADIDYLREQAENLPPGPEHDQVLRKIRQNQTAAHISEWLRSPGLRPPS